MAKNIKVYITPGSHPGPYSVYYGSIVHPDNLATMVDYGILAAYIDPLQYPELISTNGGLLISVPCVDDCDIFLYNHVCDDYVVCSTADCWFDGDVEHYIPIEIDEDTEIRLVFDSTGSMSTVRPILRTMRDDVLKNCLLPFYNNNEQKYDEKVSIVELGDEQTLEFLTYSGNSITTSKVIVLVFQDETSPYGGGQTQYFDINANRTATYDIDIVNLRSMLNGLPQDYYRGIVFRVEGYEAFRIFLEAIRDGLGQYHGDNGLSDKPEVGYVMNVLRDQTPLYYANLVITALNSLGYNLDLCQDI